MDGRCSSSQLLTRREVLAAPAALAFPHLYSPEPEQRSRLALPGPFRGRVVEVKHPGSVKDGKPQAGPVRSMVSAGIIRLTGAATEAAAWKRFFQPGDVVGIKVCPVGKPASVSQPETIAEVIRGLNLAGIPDKDIVVFNRYQEELEGWGLERALRPGIRTAAAAPKYDDLQTALDGYDPALYVEFPRVMPGQDRTLAINRRSHLCEIVSRQVTKVVNVCTLKDHASAGITMALKNMSHGFVNNVCRTHPAADQNWCDTFIPGVVAMPAIRRKVVLHVGDGLIGTYDGGPGTWNPHFRTWEYGALFFATDPVAMDRIGWRIIDAKRKAAGLPLLAQTGRKATNPGHEGFDRRQPEHVLLASKMGLGESDLAKIDHRLIRLSGS